MMNSNRYSRSKKYARADDELEQILERFHRLEQCHFVFALVENTCNVELEHNHEFAVRRQ